MTAQTTDAPPRLSSGKLAEFMQLLKGVDGVELKLTVPSNAHRATVRGLGIDPVEAEPRQVFFFDTPKLDLNKAGVVVRARRIHGGGADTVVKLRPVVPADLPDDLRRSAAFKVELDALPGGFVCSASCKGKSTGEQVRAAVGGELRLSKIFSKEQRAFYAAHAPKGVTLDALTPLGPLFVLRSKFYVKALDRKVGAEMWLYPDGSRILELSTKAAAPEAFQVAATFRVYLGEHGVDTSGLQEPKTKNALEFFSAQLPRATKRRRPLGSAGAAKRSEARPHGRARRRSRASA